MPDEVTPVAAEVSTEGAATEAPISAEVSTPTEGAGLEAASESSAEEPVRYSVKVGGAEQQVTLDELTNGYQRQSDYTRKTQELAAERQRLAQAEALAVALERNPQQTIATLAAAMGVNLSPSQTQQIAEELDEDTRFKQEMRQFVQSQQAQSIAQQQAQAQQQQLAVQHAQIDHELTDLKARYGDFNQDNLIRWAVDHQVPNLEAALMAQRFEEQQTAAVREKNRILEDKRRAQVVAPGTHQAPSSTVPGGGKPVTIREAFMQALQAHQ